MLITGDVSQHQPYYLDWPEVEAMRAGGRLELRRPHRAMATASIPVGDGRGDRGPFLTEQEWLSSERLETTWPRTAQRVAGDLERGRWPNSQPHGLPRPDASSAYHFSAYRRSDERPGGAGPLLGHDPE